MAGTSQITPAHDAIILRAMVAAVLAQRRAIYTMPGLEAVNGNGGSRVNQRLQIMLKKLCDAYGAPGLVAEEVGRATGRPAAGHTKSNRSVKKRKLEKAQES